MEKIRIITKAGKEITRNANVINKIDTDGNQYSIAIVGRSMYKVISRDFYGAVYGK